MVGDHQQEADFGLGLARKWLDQDGVDGIIDTNTFSIALGMPALVHERDRLHFDTGAATSDLTGPASSGNAAGFTTGT